MPTASTNGQRCHSTTSTLPTPDTTPTEDQSRFLQRGFTRSSELRVVLSAGRAGLSGRDVVRGSGFYSAAEFSHPGILSKPFVLGVADLTEGAPQNNLNSVD